MVGLDEWVEGRDLYVHLVVAVAKNCKGCEAHEVDNSPENHVGESFLPASTVVVGVTSSDGDIFRNNVGKHQE